MTQRGALKWILVEPNNGSVEDRCKAHPKQIRNKQPSGDFVDGMKCSNGEENGDPHEGDFDECKCGLVEGKENDAPPEIQEQLYGIDGEGAASMGGGWRFPGEETRNSHHDIEDSPNGAEQPTWRIEKGFVKITVPSSGFANGVKTCNSGNNCWYK